MAEGKSRKKRVAQWVETTISGSGRAMRIPSPVDLSDSESELNTAPSAVEKQKATVTIFSSRKVHEPGTGGLPETTDSDSEQEEEEDDEDEEEEALESQLQEGDVSDEELDM